MLVAYRMVAYRKKLVCFGSGNEPAKEKHVASKVFARENLSFSCLSQIELPYYSVDFYTKVCIHCGMQGNNRRWIIRRIEANSIQSAK